MTQEEATFHTIGSQIPDAERGQLFGKPCYKLHGKAVVCFFQNEMVFKLTGEEHREALALEGAQLFDPSGKHRPMKEWVQVPARHVHAWARLAQAAAR